MMRVCVCVKKVKRLADGAGLGWMPKDAEGRGAETSFGAALAEALAHWRACVPLAVCFFARDADVDCLRVRCLPPLFSSRERKAARRVNGSDASDACRVKWALSHASRPRVSQPRSLRLQARSAFPVLPAPECTECTEMNMDRQCGRKIGTRHPAACIFSKVHGFRLLSLTPQLKESDLISPKTFRHRDSLDRSWPFASSGSDIEVAFAAEACFN
ncbi:hypothetical protein L1887_48398 [Cichorium endivia]|nr:hypothetical protein L1887_48398 [Cichorium endivia]